MYYWAGPKPLFIPFIFRWGKNPIQRERERQRDKEKGKMLTCLQAAAESPGVNMREGEWNATEKRGRHTGVSEHSAPGPMAEWCLRDKAEAYKPRRAPQGPLLPRRLSFYLAFPLYSCVASPREQAAMDTPGDTRSDLAGCKSVLKFVFFWWMWGCIKGLKQQQRQAWVI